MDPATAMALALHRRFGEETRPGERRDRPMKWGDTQVQRNSVAPGGNTEYCYVDVGPFPEPVNLRLTANCVPANPLFFLGPIQATWTYRLVYTIGSGSATVQTFDALPRVVRCTSLQVYAARRNNSLLNEPDAMPMSIWATPQESGSGLPVPFSYFTLNFGIGTGLLNVPMPPRIATHVTMYGVAGENNKLFLQFLPPGATDEQMVLLYAPAGSGSIGMNGQPLPIPFEASVYRFRRDVTTAAKDYTLAWCV